MSGNVSPGVENKIYKEMIASLRESGIRVLLDADGELFKEGIQAKPYAIKPNRFELAQYFGVREPESLEDTVMLGCLGPCSIGKRALTPRLIALFTRN